MGLGLPQTVTYNNNIIINLPSPSNEEGGVSTATPTSVGEDSELPGVEVARIGEGLSRPG